VAIEANKRAFIFGRRAAVDGPSKDASQLPAPARDESVRELAGRRAEELTRYMNARYAERYSAVVEKAIGYEDRLSKPVGFARAVADNLYKLMAYKDEYEVARLYSDEDFVRKLREQFEDGYTLRFHLAPPLFSRRDPATGELLKKTFGPWMLPVFRVLAKGKFLRGTALDPFGYSAERKSERELIEGYIQLVDEIGSTLGDANATKARAVMVWPEKLRGYGHIKDRSLEESRKRLERLLGDFKAVNPLSAPVVAPLPAGADQL
jgi:indolepyruvate ferredoxin oxidoreductase